MKAVMRFVVFGLSSLLGIPGGGGGGGSSLNGSRKHWIFLCRAHFNLRRTDDGRELRKFRTKSRCQTLIKLYITPSYAAYVRNIALGRTKQKTKNKEDVLLVSCFSFGSR